MSTPSTPSIAEIKLAHEAAIASDKCDLSVLDRYTSNCHINSAANILTVAHMNELIAYAADCGFDTGKNSPSCNQSVNDARIAMIKELDTCSSMCADAITAIDKLRSACLAARAAIGPVIIEEPRKPSQLSGIVDGSTVDFALTDGTPRAVFAWDVKRNVYINCTLIPASSCCIVLGKTILRISGQKYTIAYENNGEVLGVSHCDTTDVTHPITNWEHVNVNLFDRESQLSLFGRYLV